MPTGRKTAAPKAADPAPDAPAAEPAPEDDDNLEEYEKNRVDLIAKLEEELKRRVAHGAEAMPTTLIGKLAMITGLIGQVKKTGRNTFHNYRYAKESDLVEAIRPLLARCGVWVWWSLYSDPAKGIVHHERRAQTKGKGDEERVAETLTVITAIFKFKDEDGTQETEPQIMMGYGDDNSDKGLYKALTGMEKYFLFKSFLVSTGDDPEGDTRADQRAQGRDAATRVQTSRAPQGTPAPRPGGRQTQQSAPQSKQIGDLVRQLGAKSTTAAIELINVHLETKIVPGDNPNEALGKALAEMDGQVAGKLIHDLRKQAEGGVAAAVEEDVAAATMPNVAVMPATPDQAPEEAAQGGVQPPEGWVDEQAGAEEGDGTIPDEA